MTERHDSPVANGNGGVEGQLARLPVVGVFKLAAIILVVMIPIVTGSYVLINGLVKNRIQDAREIGFKEADSRYVSAQQYEIRHEELVRAAGELKLRAETAEAQRVKIEMQLQQVQLTLDAIRNEQARVESRMKR